MWVSQTYLGKFSPESDVYLYYFFEDYARQRAVPGNIESLLAELGYSFRDRVSVFTPMDEYRRQIGGEMFDKFNDFWRNFSGKTPGIFLCKTPLFNFEPSHDDWIFFPITDEVISNAEKAKGFFQELHRVCREIVDHEFAKRPDSRKKGASFFDALYESSQLKLTFMGAGIDIKPLISKLSKRNRK